MDDNLRTATLTILVSRHCTGVNDDNVRWIISQAVADAERKGVPLSEFMGEVSLKVADLAEWFKNTKGTCSDFKFLYQ